MSPPMERVWHRDFNLAFAGNTAFFLSLLAFVPTLPLYVTELGGGETAVGLVVGAFPLAAIAVRTFAGPAADRWGRRPAMVLGSTIFVAAALGYLLARSIPVLLAVRVFHAAGIAFFGTAAAAYAADVSPPGRRGEALSLFGMSSNVALAASPIIALALYRWSGIGAVALGAAAAAGVALGTTLALREGRAGATAPFRSGPAGDGRLPVVLFHPRCLWPALAIFGYALTFTALLAFLPLFAEARNIANPGWFFTAYSGAVIGARLFAGRLADRLGRLAVILPGFGLVAGGLALLSVTGDLAWLVLAALVYGLGGGLVFPGVLTLAVDLVPAAERGAAMATFYNAFELGLSLGAVGAGAWVERFGLAALYPALAAVALLITGLVWWRSRRLPALVPAPGRACGGGAGAPPR